MAIIECPAQTHVRTEEETRKDGTRIVKTITTDIYKDGHQQTKTKTRTIKPHVEEEEIIYRPFRNLVPYLCCCLMPDDEESAASKPRDKSALNTLKQRSQKAVEQCVMCASDPVLCDDLGHSCPNDTAATLLDETAATLLESNLDREDEEEIGKCPRLCASLLRTALTLLLL